MGQAKWGVAAAALACAIPLVLWGSLQLSHAPLRGLRIAGADVGARDRAEFEAWLEQRAQEWALEEIEVAIEGESTQRTVTRAALGAERPVKPLVESALQLGRSGNPIRDVQKWWRARRGELDLPWHARVERERVSAFVERVRLRVERPPIAGVTDGQDFTLPGRDGVALDFAPAVRTLSRGLSSGLARVVLATQVVKAPPPIALGSPDGELFGAEPAEKPEAPPISPAPATSAEVATWQPLRNDDCYNDGPRGTFCDGPRRVPAPFGPSRELAERIGLGRIDTVGQLIHSGPKPEWLHAAARQAAGSGLLWPVPQGRRGRGFGYVRSGALRDRLHAGIDIVAPIDSAVHAADHGVVAYADNFVRAYGNLLVIVHSNGAVSLSAHCRAIYVFAGQYVQRGQLVAQVGMTGLSLGPHLHFEYRNAGTPEDPEPHFQTGAP